MMHPPARSNPWCATAPPCNRAAVYHSVRCSSRHVVAAGAGLEPPHLALPRPPAQEVREFHRTVTRHEVSPTGIGNDWVSVLLANQFYFLVVASEVPSAQWDILDRRLGLDRSSRAPLMASTSRRVARRPHCDTILWKRAILTLRTALIGAVCHPGHSSQRSLQFRGAVPQKMLIISSKLLFQTSRNNCGMWGKCGDRSQTPKFGRANTELKIFSTTPAMPSCCRPAETPPGIYAQGLRVLPSPRG